jgi:hypothetical protein
MSENFEPGVEASTKPVSAFGARAKERFLAQVRQEPVKTFAIFFAGSILLGALVGYRISRIREESRRQRVVEDWMREVTSWIGRHGRDIAAPIKTGLETTKAAAEDFSNFRGRVGRRVRPFFEKQKHLFSNLY